MHCLPTVNQHKMIDTRLYSATNRIVRNNEVHYEEMDLVTADSTPATSVEILANKVVKFMLTARGTDAFEPNYGGVSMHHGQICDAYLPKLRLEVLDDISRCQTYINQSESQLAANDADSERLYTIVLRDIRYNPLVTPTRVDVYIEIISTTGKREVVAITNNTDQ